MGCAGLAAGGESEEEEEEAPLLICPVPPPPRATACIQPLLWTVRFQFPAVWTNSRRRGTAAAAEAQKCQTDASLSPKLH